MYNLKFNEMDISSYMSLKVELSRKRKFPSENLNKDIMVVYNLLRGEELYYVSLEVNDYSLFAFSMLTSCKSIKQAKIIVHNGTSINIDRLVESYCLFCGNCEILYFSLGKELELKTLLVLIKSSIENSQCVYFTLNGIILFSFLTINEKSNFRVFIFLGCLIFKL